MAGFCGGFPLEREYTIGRFRLLRDAVEENYGRLDRQRLVNLLSCSTDGLCPNCERP